MRRVPNFILAFIPAEISTETLNTMTAFAVSFRLSLYDAIYSFTTSDGWPVVGRFSSLGTPFVHGRKSRARYPY